MNAIGPSECPRVVQISGFAVHRDFGLGPLQPVGPVEGRELRALVGIHDLGRPKFVDGLVQSLDAEVRLPSPRAIVLEPVANNSALLEPVADHGSMLEMRHASTLRVNQSMMATR